MSTKALKYDYNIYNELGPRRLNLENPSFKIPTKDENLMRIMSYNVNSFNNKDQIIKVILEIQPDILGLVENRGIRDTDNNFLNMYELVTECSSEGL